MDLFISFWLLSKSSMFWLIMDDQLQPNALRDLKFILPELCQMLYIDKLN